MRQCFCVLKSFAEMLNSLYPGETPGYLTYHPDQRCLHYILLRVYNQSIK